MKHAINWFEIPVRDMDRAEQFYAQLLDVPLKRMIVAGLEHAILPYEPPGVGGALVHDPRRKPSRDGALLYLGTADIDAALGRAEALGAERILPKTDIGEHGFIALLCDSEGNLVGLHTPRAR